MTRFGMSDAQVVQTKAALTSVTLWGIVVSLIGGILTKHGWQISDVLKGDTAQFFSQVAAYLIGPAMALFGRWRATRPLSVAGGTKKVVSNTTTLVLLLMLSPLLAIAAGGCTSRAELASTRDAMDQGTATIRQEHGEWTRELGPATQPDDGISGHRELLPHLSQADVQIRKTAEKEYEDLVAASRSHDADSLNPFASKPTTQPSP